ncbi:MAG TPA: phenylalanine--tRNA ligase subunit beta, partial [Myxococcota bacterium]|nr:phenylalanine--tRNA ligase subunit beta [Myxococcota bacterium]
VIGKVEAVEPHPKADKIRVTTVTDGTKSYTVVCGAPNVAVGQHVAFAQIGAKLPGLEIGKRAIRGVESEGMLCGKSELGLEEKSDGIWVLPDSAELGKPLFSQVASGATIELAVTANRPDLLSHYGVAREVAAFTGKRMKIDTKRPTEKGVATSTLVRVVVDDHKACKRFVARALTNVKVGPSPDWMRERLEAIGQRSINNVVDATNYVLMELGQPLHAYDLSTLAAESGLPTIHVRHAQQGEKLTTLDGVERELGEDDLIIADAQKAIGIAGVMGGAATEVRETTTTVVLEGAWFEPVSVRRTSKRFDLKTEAARRFERGADAGVTARAVDRCAQLLAEMGAADVGKGLVEVAAKNEPAREITLRMGRVGRILGFDLEAEEVVKLLEPLEIRCIARTEGVLRIQPPTFRPDLSIEVDLIEEIARRHGYDNIPEHLPDAGGPFKFEPLAVAPTEIARRALLPIGLTEIVTYGFGGPSRFAPFAERCGDPVRLINPLGEELSALRTTLLPGLFDVATTNIRQGVKSLKLFEIGTTFRKSDRGSGRKVTTIDPARAAEAESREAELVDERAEVGILMVGGRYDGRWHERGENIDFSDLAGVLDDLFEAFDPRDGVVRRPASIPGYHPHAGAELMVGDRRVGVAGIVHPDTLAHFGLSGTVVAAELSLEALGSVAKRAVAYRELPKFPSTRRDLAVVADRTLPAETLRVFIAANAGGPMGRDVVERVSLFDVYTGKPIADTHISLAFAIDYRSRERTLTDVEVNAAFEALQASVKQAFQVEIRS